MLNHLILFANYVRSDPILLSLVCLLKASEQTHLTVCLYAAFICWLILRVCEYLHVCASVRLNRGHSRSKRKDECTYSYSGAVCVSYILTATALL